MDSFIQLLTVFGAVVFMSAGSEAGIFDNILNSVAPKKHIHVEDLHVETCGSGYSGLELQNIQISNGKDELKISGTVNAKTILSAPLTVKMSMKRKLLGVWVKVPCTRDFGSCTYENLCNYGYAEDTTCPAYFVRDRVPCRCPIQKGLYIIPSEASISLADTRLGALAKGKYKVTGHLVHKGSELACYSASFTLKTFK